VTAAVRVSDPARTSPEELEGPLSSSRRSHEKNPPQQT
jgi:hypothetical protein